MKRVLTFSLMVCLGVAAVHAADWPQWQGPDRTRISKETGLWKEWPSGGPRVVWTANNLGTGYGSMSVAGDRVYLQGARGHLYIQSENNLVGLAEATSAGYCEKGRFEIPDKGQPSWAHPVISDGRLYVRNQDTLLAYDIKSKS